MARKTDEELLDAWRQGDKEAGDKLVRKHFGVVYRFFRAKLPSQAEDMTQRTFLAASEATTRYRGDGSFRAFLLAIARRQLFNALRKVERSRRVFDPMTMSAVDAQDPDAVSLGGLMAHRQTEGLLLQALRALPIEFQITLELFYWEHLSIKEIAQVLEIADGTVKSRLGRARGMLRARLEELSNDPAAVETTMTNLQSWAEALRDALSGSGSK